MAGWIVRSLICLQLVLLVSANWNGVARRFCGKTLTRTLASFCEGKYQSMMDTGVKLPDFPSNHPFFEGSSLMEALVPASDLLRQRREHRGDQQYYVYRGIADECCKKPCTMLTMMSYCRWPEPTRRTLSS